jgi:hypothetical protein
LRQHAQAQTAVCPLLYDAVNQLTVVANLLAWTAAGRFTPVADHAAYRPRQRDSLAPLAPLAPRSHAEVFY